MSEILKNELYLGDMNDANNAAFLKQHNITCIICVADHVVIESIYPDINIYQYELSDDNYCKISSYFNEISKLIEKEDVVLINCVAGISRSPTFVIAYLMKYFGMTLHEAYNDVVEKRNIICPNIHFMECLLNYEFELYNKNSLTRKQCIDLFYYS